MCGFTRSTGATRSVVQSRDAGAQGLEADGHVVGIGAGFDVQPRANLLRIDVGFFYDLFRQTVQPPGQCSLTARL